MAEGFEQHREWEKTLHGGRWSVVSWPEEFGGLGRDAVDQALLMQELYAAGAPIDGLNIAYYAMGRGLTLIVPPPTPGDTIEAENVGTGMIARREGGSVRVGG